jgi:hypothetical protein
MEAVSSQLSAVTAVSQLKADSRWLIALLREVRSHRIGNLVRPPANLILILALDHDSQQRLGPGISHQ